MQSPGGGEITPAETGTVVALRDLSREIWDFLRDSTPERRRQRYGDVEFDWDFRVNTTSGTVGWRDRLLGVFHSPYQPTEPAVFHEMMAHVPATWNRLYLSTSVPAKAARC